MNRFLIVVVVSVLGTFGLNAETAELKLEKKIVTRPFISQLPIDHNLRDLESLAYVPEDNALIIGDDGEDAAHICSVQSGARLSIIDDKELLKNFKGTQDENEENGGSHLNEIETGCYDRENGILYIINTVNNKELVPPRDIAAIYKLIRKEDGTYSYDAWKVLPVKYGYGAAVVIKGMIYIAHHGGVHAYDMDKNLVSDDPILTLKGTSSVSGLSYDGKYLWVASNRSKNILWKIDWETKAVLKTFDLSEAFVDLRGVAVTDDRIYLGEGAAPTTIRNGRSGKNEIHVFFKDGK